MPYEFEDADGVVKPGECSAAHAGQYIDSLEVIRTRDEDRELGQVWEIRVNGQVVSSMAITPWYVSERTLLRELWLKAVESMEAEING